MTLLHSIPILLLNGLTEIFRSVLTSKRLDGQHIGAFAPYGYKKDPDKKGHLIIDEEAASVVREVFQLFASGYGKTAIARLLNERGIPNPTEYKRLQGLRYKRPPMKNGTLWKYFAISDMLINEVYIGNMVQGKSGSISYKTKICRPRPIDVKINKKTGLLETSRGISVNTDPSKVSKFGVVSRVDSLPTGLDLKAVGTSGHFEITPAKPMTMGQYKMLLKQIKYTIVGG